MRRVRTNLFADRDEYEELKVWYAVKDQKYGSIDTESMLKENQRLREEFLAEKELSPPKTLRLIDCERTVSPGEDSVVLVDWKKGLPYTAVSHTWGLKVYEAFNCECATKFAGVFTPPRCPHGQTCPKSRKQRHAHKEIIKDILRMCQILWQAGSKYVWHDGVCIAQHDAVEVDETIQHMGWIYSSASETVIFLHYVGIPMAPIRHEGDVESRWHTRVWTLQEAALSQRRRYCVRVGADLSACQTLTEFERELAKWYQDCTSEVKVIEEWEYVKLLLKFMTVLQRLMFESSAGAKLRVTKSMKKKAWDWIECIERAFDSLLAECVEFPSFVKALVACSRRSSKHEGDRMNNILALAGVKDFVAPKDFKDDSAMEKKIIEFFSRQGTKGLATAVFATNMSETRMRHSWVPDLTAELYAFDYRTRDQSSWYMCRNEQMEADKRELEGAHFQVLSNGDLEMSLTGDWGIVEVEFYFKDASDGSPIDLRGYEELQAIPMVVSLNDRNGSRMHNALDYSDSDDHPRHSTELGAVVFVPTLSNAYCVKPDSVLRACLVFPAKKVLSQHSDTTPVAPDTRALVIPANTTEGLPVQKLAFFLIALDLQKRLRTGACPAIKFISKLIIR